MNSAKYSDLSKVTKEIDDKIIGAVTNVTSKIAEELSAKFVTKKELTDTNKTIKKNKVSTTRY